MINRTLIRLKIVQLIYAFYQNGGKNIDIAEKELLFSLSKAYDLYNYMLLLIVSVSRYAFEEVERKEQLNRVGHIDEVVSHRFADNQFAAQLEKNKQLQEFVDTKKKSWSNDIDYIKKLYTDIIQSEYYTEYMALEKVTYADDRELWRKLYKNIIMKDERIDDILEEQSLYWNDDKEIVDTFVLKTIKRFEEKNKSTQQLLPEYDSEEDKDYARKLFRATIMNGDEYQHYMSEASRNWDFSRLAYMDIVIMQIAIAEMLNFPSIPVSVTINEFVEISKLYSTPRSSSYINGMLDGIAHHLANTGRMLKPLKN